MIKGNNRHVFFHIWHAYLPPFAERLFCINHMECCYCMKLKSHSTHEKRQNRTEIIPHNDAMEPEMEGESSY